MNYNCKKVAKKQMIYKRNSHVDLESILNNYQ